jgi:hypothetical protein
MRGLRILLLVVLPLSFAFGLAWGWRIHRDREARGARTEAVKTVRLLSLRGLVPSSTLKDLESIAPVKVEMTEVATPGEILAAWAQAKAAGHEPDLVTLLYSQIPETSKAVKIQPLTEARLASYKWISKDFVDWPRSKEWPTTAPLSWGFDGWALAKPPKDKKVLWVATLAMTSGCVNVDEAHVVAEWLIARKSAIDRARETKLPSTSLETETADVDASLKPSNLRRIPLTDYVIDAPVETPKDEVSSQGSE